MLQREEALEVARRLVDARLDQIGDGVLRGTYLDAPHVRAIRQGDLTA